MSNEVLRFYALSPLGAFTAAVDVRPLRSSKKEEERLGQGWPGWHEPVVRLSRDAANLTGLVLGCIVAKFCKKICV